MAVSVDLLTNEDAAPAVTRLSDIITADKLDQIATWLRLYLEVLFRDVPDYKRTIQTGKDTRHLCLALRDWRGDDPEDYFGDLGAWAEKRIKELGVNRS